VDRIENRRLAWTGDQPGQNARGEPGRSQGELGLSRLHVSMGPGPVRDRETIPERGAVGEGGAAGAGGDKCADGSSSRVHAIAATDSEAKPAKERLGELLQLRISAACIPEDQLACRLSAGEPSEASSEPAAIPVAGGRDVLRALAATGS